LAEVHAATAREIIDCGTSVGASACAVGNSNARAQPIMKTAVNSKSRLSVPVTNAAVIISAAAA
jgi:hypothetical protein